MSDFTPTARLLLLSFTVVLVPGGATVQNANASYEIVGASGRHYGPITRGLDLSQVQATVNAAAAAILGQLLAEEELVGTWPITGYADSGAGLVSIGG